MASVANISLLTLCCIGGLCLFSVWVFIMILGPNRKFRGTAVEQAYIYISTTLPERLETWLRVTIGTGLMDRAEKIMMMLFGRRNPIFQIFGIVLYWLGVGAFVMEIAPNVPNRYVGSWQWILILIILGVNIWSYTMACIKDPGIVTKENVDRACQLFKHDKLLYFDTNCRTCHLRKPARSKHCSACGFCVQMMDHHCIWLNNCVGLGNVRYFLIFLISFALVCSYGSYIFGTVLLELRHRQGLDTMQVWDDDKGEMVPLSFRSSLLHLLDSNIILAITFVLLVVLSPAIAIFSGLQIRMGMLGYTSNEESKWESVQEAILDGVAFWIEKEDGRKAIEVIEKEDQAKDTRPRTPVRLLAEVENKYDRGAWNNLKMLFGPPPPSFATAAATFGHEQPNKPHIT